MLFRTIQKDGVIKSKIIDQSQLTSECWMIQIQGIKACSKCEFLNTDECGGKNILKIEAEKLWGKLGDIPVNDGEIEEPFEHFIVGSDREEIWHWFEKTFNLSVAKDLMNLQ